MLFVGLEGFICAEILFGQGMKKDNFVTISLLTKYKLL